MVNPNGMVALGDGGTPRIISGYANEFISGGQFVGASGAFGAVGSGADSFATSDIQWVLSTGSDNFIGIATQDAASGALLGVASRGLYLVPVEGNAGSGPVEAGRIVRAGADSSVAALGSNSGATTSSVYLINNAVIGRVLTAGSGAQYVVLDLRG